MPKFRKLPIEIEAVQVTWKTWSEVCDLLGDALKAENPTGARMIPAEEASDTCGEGPEYIAFEVRTAHGDLATVRHGDWVIPEKAPGRFYPCKPGVFAATYAEPQLVTTIEQLRAQPVGAVLLDNGTTLPRPWQILPRASRRVIVHASDDSEYDLADTERIVRLLGAYGPFRVLHTPEVLRG